MVRRITSTTDNDGHALDAALQRVLAEALRRLNAGERVSDEDLMASHPELMPRLGEELIALRRIRRAYLTARKAGPMDSPVPPLDDEQLEAPIVLPDDDRFLSRQTSARIEGYTILEEIGAGGQATVFKAVQECTGRTVAIKVMLGGALAGSRHRARFDREVSILAKIDHPHIVSVIDRGCMADGSYYFVMSYVDGVPLDALRVEEGEVAGASQLRLWIKIALAVHEAHKHGIVHRDLKPSNILVDKRGEPCVMDFGLARPLADLPGNSRMPNAYTRTGQIIGSLPWASPEQANGDPDGADVRSDVYSLGVLFYQNLTGRFPYSVDGPVTEVLKNIAKAIPVAPGRIVAARNAGAYTSRRFRVRMQDGSAPLDAVILKALAKNPADRYLSAAALAEDLEHVLAGRKTVGRRPHGLLSILQTRSFFWVILATLSCVVASGIHWIDQRPARRAVIPLPSIANRFGMRFVRIAPQAFSMGSPTSEIGHTIDERLHGVRLTRAIYMGVTEVTQGQYQAITGKNPSDERFLGENLPVQCVSWNDAVAFCEKLSERDPTHHYRLPTEAEWECACRAGSQLRMPDDDQLSDIGWFKENSKDRLHPVAQLRPNAWGLFDMQGGVAEWCLDGYDMLYGVTTSDNVVDPTGPEHPLMHVVRGGDFSKPEDQCRAASRSALDAHAHLSTLGFRVVIEDLVPQSISTSPPTSR